MDYACLSNYSPRGTNDFSIKSRDVIGGVKSGSTSVIQSAFNHFGPTTISLFSPFLNKDTILIPVPRSAPLIEDAIWPSRVIADLLIKNGYGKAISTCVKRVVAIERSASIFSADKRPSVKTHLESLSIVPEILHDSNITLIDDVLTLGRTSYACAIKLQEVYPEKTIRLFVLSRTKSLEPNIEKFIDPSIGKITYNEYSGKTSRSS